MQGIAVVDKPQGWTSHDVVAKMRGILGTRAIGHAGTLDPMATGVLPLLVGKATRALEDLPDGKAYTATVRFGLQTDTQDITGTTLATSDLRPTRQQLLDLLPRFTGALKQIPPMYSAVKINGQRLYKAARAGKDIERPARDIVIERLQLLDFSADEAVLDVACSGGTYVRTLCHDIGEALGCYATLAALRRTAACGYTLQQAHTLEQWQQAEKPPLLPTDSVYGHLPPLTVDDRAVQKLRNGAAVPVPATPDGRVRVYALDSTFLMVGLVADGQLKVAKGFMETAQK